MPEVADPTVRPAPPARPLPERVTLPLLTLITQQSLDEDYLVAAERRAAGTQHPSRRPRRVAAIVIAVFGLLVSTAAVQTSRNASVDNDSRNTLITEANARRATVSSQQDQIVKLRQRNSTLDEQNQLLASTAQAALNRLRRLQVRTGFIAVTGEGVRITVDGAPDGDATQNVRDEDLELLVNGLWQAGAEAIAINGQRLTVLSSIRNSSVAIRINGNDVSLSPPYTVLAIGDTATLQSRLYNTTSGLAFKDLVDQLGFVFSMQNEDSLALPEAPAKMLRLESSTAGTSGDLGKNTDKETAP